MFYGQYEHTIDDKSRITLPARFREAFADGVVLSRALDRTVAVYPRRTWHERVESRLAQLDPFSRQSRELSRFFFSGASLDDLDKQGRVLVPPSLLEHGGLGREVVIVGSGDHLEIWDRAAWRDHIAVVEGGVEDAAERLADQRS